MAMNSILPQYAANTMPGADLSSLDIPSSVSVPKYTTISKQVQVPYSVPIETTPDATWVPDANDPNGGEYVLNSDSTPQYQTKYRTVTKQVQVPNPAYQASQQSSGPTQPTQPTAPTQPSNTYAGTNGYLYTKNADGTYTNAGINPIYNSIGQQPSMGGYTTPPLAYSTIGGVTDPSSPLASGFLSNTPIGHIGSLLTGGTANGGLLSLLGGILGTNHSVNAQPGGISPSALYSMLAAPAINSQMNSTEAMKAAAQSTNGGSVIASSGSSAISPFHSIPT
jgi:hypothetical protein